jgi:cation diffusion facilitator CzcD-associated flavoprotein CzcO
MSGRRHARVAIVGSGFGGIGAAIRLGQDGVDDVALFERASEIGGTWRDNSYPGCACDVESLLYSFSFAPNAGWTRTFSAQPEIWAYLRATAARYGIDRLVRFGHDVRSATWNAADSRWSIATSAGDYTADMLVMASGALSDPVVPALPGLERFAGRVFHSARWDHGYGLAGKRVAVIGTGASAIQFVPAIQPLVASLALFQRTPPWVLPRHDRARSPGARALFGRLPALQRLVRGWIYARRELLVLAFRRPRVARLAQRMALANLRRAVADPALRARLTPRFTLGCKRVLLSDDYYPALTRPNVDLVTAQIVEITDREIVTADGTRREVDAIIFGTGFQAADPPLAHHVRGRDGRTLTETWGGSMTAHAGTTVAGFPNLFLLPGPNTGLGHTSVLYMLEAQIDHLRNALRLMRRTGARTIEPTADAQAAYVRAVDRRMRGTVWTSGGCRSWYLDRTGRNSTLWPDFSFRFRRRVERVDPRDYRLDGRAAGR